MQTVRIRIEASAGGGYVIHLLAGAGSAAESDGPSARIPADLDAANAPAELGNGAVDEAVQTFVKDNDESIHFVAIGEFLGGLVLRGEVAQRWDALRGQHPEGLRALLDIDPPELRQVAWELMSRDQGRLFLDDQVVLSRVDELHEDKAQELVPLRLLVVEGERDDEIGTLDEIRGIKAALPAFRGQIDAEFLSAPTEDALSRAFKRVRPHIFHFVGHGIRDSADDRWPALKVRDWELTRQYILDRFLTPSPRLVVLNACRSGDVEGVRSLTEALFSRGAAAVIAMQGDVRGQAAGRFGSALYKGLAERKPVDRAVAGARRDVRAKGGNNQARDWFLPSLTLRVLPEQVLPLVCGLENDELQLVERDLYKPVRLFVDRSDKRWELVEAADPDQDQGSPERVVLIVGDMQVGKTALVNWIRMRCALRGRRMRYVSFKGDNLNFVGALGVIEETPEDLASRAGPADAFDRFNYDVGFLANGTIPPDPAGVELPRRFPQIPAPLQLGGRNDELILESFRTALETSTSEKDPLLLVFDDVGKVSATDFQKWIYPHLINPIADGDPPHVRVILVLSNDQRRDYWPSESTLGKEIRVDAVPLDEYEAWAEDCLLALGLELGAQHEALIQLAKSWVPATFKPTELARLVGIVEER